MGDTQHTTLNNQPFELPTKIVVTYNVDSTISDINRVKTFFDNTDVQILTSSGAVVDKQGWLDYLKNNNRNLYNFLVPRTILSKATSFSFFKQKGGSNTRRRKSNNKNKNRRFTQRM